jgi:hypothetical protein
MQCSFRRFGGISLEQPNSDQHRENVEAWASPDLQPKLAELLDGTPATENPLSNYQLAKMIDTPVKKML